MTAGWRLLVDRGGTFTDVVAVAPDGTRRVAKVLSTAGDDPVVAAAAELAAGGAPGAVHLGTTLATNALLERKGEITAFAVTAGLDDLLEIGTQQRPDLFSLAIRKPAPLHALVVPIDERVLADGTIRLAPDPARVRASLEDALRRGARSLAVALVHAFAHPAHERLVEAVARAVGFEHVVLSSGLGEGPGLLARAETAVVDAALTPVLRRHLEGLERRLPGRLLVMQSNGALAPAERVRGKDAVFSGPAGGVMALAAIAREAGLPRVLGFDMGGTSTDVSRWTEDEGFERASERVVSGVTLRGATPEVVTIAAGGGSIVARSSGRLVVGPASAGADPGPACHGRGGPPTVTDADVVLGRVQPGFFPALFGPDGRQAIDAAASRAAFAPLAEELRLSIEAVAAGTMRLADEAMAQAIGRLSVARGRDARDHALVAFGGAGPQHACRVAEILRVREVLVHPLSGVLSALGMGLADAGRSRVLPVLATLDEAGLALARRALGEAEAEERADLVAQGFGAATHAITRTLVLRHVGVEGDIEVPLVEAATPAGVRADFDARHRRLFGHARKGDVEIGAARVDVAARLTRMEPPRLPDASGPAHPVARVTAWIDDGADLREREVPVHLRGDLLAGHEIAGPSILADATTTIVVDAGWTARVDRWGHVRMTRTAALADAAARSTDDPVELELFGNRFMDVATRMGETLRRTSLSPNIKERLDFSCALFTQTGELVANAPHVPVHLGAMGETVRSLLASRGAEGMRPGMALLSNDPYHGGSHLPDVTVVTPVFVDDRLAFFVASRGHHADVGGIVPGSMPPHATDVAQEGVRLHDVVLVEDGVLREAEVAALMAAGPHPVRGIPDRLADLAAQAAANAVGAALLVELGRRHGLERVQAFMAAVRHDAARAVRETLARLPQGVHRFADAMDDGARIEVAVTIERDRATFDFAGTSGVHAGNLNAPRAITVAAVLYVVRALVGRPIPLNAGCLEPIEIRVPPRTMLSPEPPAAVSGGNVETSMRIADVILAALRRQAGSQGTMNNVTFGDATFGYYETIGGGSGAGPDFDGASAVHSHLTNTRLTDVEILERRHPVVVREVSIRRGTGGSGRHRGGDGMRRVIEALRPMQAAVLAQRRTRAPFGLDGGGDGAVGRDLILRADGSVEVVPPHAPVDLSPGDALSIETPGGGAHGSLRRDQG